MYDKANMPLDSNGLLLHQTLESKAAFIESDRACFSVHYKLVTVGCQFYGELIAATINGTGSRTAIRTSNIKDKPTIGASWKNA